MNTKNVSEHPCPICQKMMCVIGTDTRGRKIGSCGCTWKFKRTRSQKEMDRRYVRTPDGGLELIKE